MPGQVLRIVPAGGVVVWWDGMPHDDLITFDQNGFKLLWGSLGGDLGLQEPVISTNVKIFLNDLIKNHDFKTTGPIHLDEARVKHLLHINP